MAEQREVVTKDQLRREKLVAAAGKFLDEQREAGRNDFECVVIGGKLIVRRKRLDRKIK
jgi:hypothetical protein